MNKSRKILTNELILDRDKYSEKYYSNFLLFSKDSIIPIENLTREEVRAEIKSIVN
jgi:hypothetical protein